MSQASDPQVEEMIRSLVHSKKYAALQISEQTVRDVLLGELAHHRHPKDALKAARAVLHNIVAPYLGDPDYPAAMVELSAAFSIGTEEAIWGACRSILEQHVSTRERLPLLPEFYERLWQITGVPEVIVDVACGLNPLTLPWMGLPRSVHYYAYDIHTPRIGLINHFMHLWGLPSLAEVRDCLVELPTVAGDVALIFKEVHRMEQRRRGVSRRLVERLRVRWVMISLPTESMHGGHDLLQRQRALVSNLLTGTDWRVVEALFPGEVVFCVEKQGAH